MRIPGITRAREGCFAGKGEGKKHRFCGGGDRGNGQDLVRAVCLSLLSNPVEVEALLQQSWVAEWHGWKDLEQDDSDANAMAVASRFLQIAGHNAPIRAKANLERLQGLEAKEGLRVRVASSHGVNNCLIDSVLLGLVDQGLAPQDLSLADRERLCRECREMLHVQHGVPRGVYLDGHRDSPRIVKFFLEQKWKRNTVVRVRFYDPLDMAEVELAPGELEYVDVPCAGAGGGVAAVLHVHNHTLATGQGYHFDALLCKRESEDRVVAGGVRDNDEVAVQAAETIGTVATASHVSVKEVQALLQTFFRARAAHIKIEESDARDIVAAGADRERLSLKLHTLHQAGLAFADSGWHASQRLLDQWLGYCNSYRQGPPQRLGTAEQPTAERPKTAVERRGCPEPELRASQIGRKRSGMAAARQQKAEDDAPRKRLRTKTPAAGARAGDRTESPVASRREGGEEAEADMFVLRCAAASTDPRKRAEEQVHALSMQLQPYPTWPERDQTLASSREAFDLPLCHCAFAGCAFTAETEEELMKHLVASHAVAVTKACGAGLDGTWVIHKYTEAVARICQAAPPVANVSIDRRALRAYQKTLETDNLSCLICFVCARKYPHMGTGKNQDITWVQPVNCKQQMLFGRSYSDAERLLSMCTFQEKYVKTATVFAQTEMTEELKDWSATASFDDGLIEVICCPEDKVCPKRCSPEKLCEHCWTPICRSCKMDLVWHGKQPAAALSNDMMVYYGPRDVFAAEVTVMEMLCASPCLTTMICFSLEQKLRGDRALDQDAWMNRHRMAVRGNATTFPLAWEDLLQQLQELDGEAAKRSCVAALPHTGSKLRELVSVIVKTPRPQEAGDLGRIIHQARVRRAVVVRLLEDAVARGHPAFHGLCMESMYSKAQGLPEDGVPDELRYYPTMLI